MHILRPIITLFKPTSDLIKSKPIQNGKSRQKKIINY